MSNPEALLPPGFRFHPTDEELILYYLRNQATSLPCPVSIIAEVDIYKFDPWELPAKATFGDREWYFFSPRDRKYPNGVRPNRAAASGYWKATGTDKPIVTSGPGKENIGVKKALVFYKGKPPKGIKTKWIMHEYRLAETPDATHNRPMKNRDSMRLDDWVLCRIYKKSNNLPISSSDGDHEDTNSEVAYFPPGLGGGPPQNDVKLPKSSSLSQLFDDADYSVLSRLLSENPSDMVSPDQLGSHLGHANLNHLSLLHGGGNGAISFSPLQLVPMETPASVIGSCLKRQRTSADYADNRANPLHPHKKYNSTPCTNYTDLAPVDNSSPQCNVLGQPFLHQQMLLNSHLGLQ